MPGRRSTRAAWMNDGAWTHAGGIDPRFAAGLEEQRHIEHHEAAAVPGGAPQEAGLVPAHQGMDQRFKASERSGITDDTGAKALTVDAGSPSLTGHHTGKGAADRPDGGAAWTVEPVHAQIGVVDEGATTGEHGGNGGLSHADRTCQAEHEHRFTHLRCQAPAITPCYLSRFCNCRGILKWIPPCLQHK